mgnify:CR=1 FL=1
MTDSPQGSKFTSLIQKRIPASLAKYVGMLQLVYLSVPSILIFLISVGILPVPRDGNYEAVDYGVRDGLVFLLAFISVFCIAASSCTLGMFISFVSRTPLDKHDAYSSEDQKAMLLSISIFGAIFGCILVLMFLGGFIAGDLFPALTQSGLGFRDIFFGMTHVSNVAKLIVWAFVAGFSERLIPNLLNKLAAQIKEGVK